MPLKLKAMLAATPPDGAAARQLFLAEADGYAKHRLPVIEPRVAQDAVRTAALRAKRRDRFTADVASAVTDFDPEKAHRAVFQLLTFAQDAAGRPIIPVHDLPTAGVAFILSALFADTQQSADCDSAPLAIGFAGSRKIEAVDFFAFKAWNPPPLNVATDFDAAVYAWALDLFRTWLTRHIVPGPIDPPAARTADAAQVLRVEVEASRRDGTGLAVIASRDAVPTKDMVELKDDLQKWARRVLLAQAPWASCGLLTVRRGDFGLYDGWAAIVAGPRDAGERDIPAIPIPTAQEPNRQPQFEAMPAAAVEDRLVRGYAPLRVRPLLLTSEPAFEALDLTDGPRLTATAVELSWALVDGAHAVLGEADAERAAAFWLADRETTAFRPFKQPPHAGEYSLSFATPLDPGFPTAAGLLPTAHTEEGPPLRPAGAANTVYAEQQAFAPAFTATARIALRPGSWVAMRAGRPRSVVWHQDRAQPRQ